MSDKPTSELKADLLALIDWLTANPHDPRAADFKRQVREMRAELEARGETLQVPKPPEPQRGSVPNTSYRAVHRVQMLTVGDERPDEPPDILAVHEDRGDGTALCGQPLTSYMDRDGTRHDVFWARYGEGPVNCGRCARIAAETPGYEPLMEPQGESVRTVSGGAFETNRRRH